MAPSLSTGGPVIEKLLEHYELYARAAGFSRSQINNVRMRLRLLDRFLGGIKDIGEVTTDDFRRFLVDLRDRPVCQGLRTEKPRKLSSSSIHSYAVTIKTFFQWLKNEQFIHENTLESVLTPPTGEKVSKAYSEDPLPPFAEFLTKFMRTIKWQIPKGVQMDAAYYDLLKFQTNVTQAAGEKSAIQSRHDLVVKYFYEYSKNGKMRDELLDREIFTTLAEAKVLISEWRKEYNQIRPHSSLNYRPPAPEAILTGVTR